MARIVTSWRLVEETPRADSIGTGPSSGRSR